jgi:hypothetical protein
VLLLAFVFQIASDDIPRPMALLEEAIVKHIWDDVFGEAVFTVQIIPTKQTGEDVSLAGKRETYIEMVQLYLAKINGLVNFTKKFLLCRTNKVGTPDIAIRKSAQSIVRYRTLNRDTILLSATQRGC